MKFGSLFSGIGGFELGFERAGHTCMWQVENDKHCLTILNKHWPDVKKYNDVRTATNLEKVDCVVGGFPCQDLSIAGDGRGFEGNHRSSLFFEFIRVLREVRPRLAVIENVGGFLSSNGGKDFALALSLLEKCGYWWAYRMLDAKYFGVPQQRRRVFIVASSEGLETAAKTLFDGESCIGVATKNVKSKTSFTPVFSDGTTAYQFYRSSEAARSLSTHNRIDLDTEDFIVENGIRVRRYTELERERLMGFPDYWTEGVPDTARYRMTGNAVAVPVAEWLGSRLQ